MKQHRWKIFQGAALCGVLLGLGAAPAARADVLYDNLTKTNTDVETISGADWRAASFGTGTTAAGLSSVTLLLSNTTAGSAELDLYTDGGLQPGTLVGTLTSPTAYTGSLSAETFTASNLTLSANSTYWAVLKANTGTFNWGWTSDNTGSGAGYTTTWGSSSDAGQSWFSYYDFPLQMRVTTASTVPDPGFLTTMLTGGLLGAGILSRRKRVLNRSGA